MPRRVITREFTIMSKNYVALAGAVVEAIGGGGNVAAVTHCMTRLRFVLNDDSAVDGAP